MSESERERAALIEALGRISMFCNFRPATTTLEQVEHLLVAILEMKTSKQTMA
jgi:hypothetical protein